MELIFGSQTVQFETMPSVKEIIEKINELMTDQYYFSHLVVDGVEVYEEPENYLFERLVTTSRIEVIAKTIREYVNELLLISKDYIKRAIPELTVLADGFYQNATAAEWKNFSEMLEGVQWLNQMTLLINNSKERPLNWDEIINLSAKLKSELENLEEAVGNKDNILIADIMQYELLPLYEGLESEIHTTLVTEGYHHDFN